PELVAYPSGEQWKLAAGWLIDQAGLKGYRDGDAGIHDKQALVLVNHGHASGRQLVDMAKYAQASVLEKFAVKLEPEVNLIGSKGRVNLDDI
ncbi:MAG: UDP-N-acetylenolpyruvoylglucosamine reductase, partial [Gammaproteobacteria bacterium]